MRRLKAAIERRTHVLWGTYRWRTAPVFFLAIGTSSRSDCWLEVGVLGRQFYVAPEPR